MAVSRYEWAGELTLSIRRRLWLGDGWRDKLIQVRQTPIPAVPAWFESAIRCISDHEEYGFDGPNTSAGYFGMVYPPSAYPSPGPELAAQYGDSWLSIPLDEQERIVYALWQANGWSPWTTAPGCGLV